MISDKKTKVERRNVLKSVCTAGLGATTFGAIGSPVSASEYETANEWECNTDCPKDEIMVEDDFVPSGVDYEREGAVSIHWHSSGWSNPHDAWAHIFSVSGGAGSDSNWSGGHVYGQYYDVRSPRGDIQSSHGDEKYGHYPTDDEDVVIPGWGQPLVEATVGTISAGAGWFLAVQDALRESMGHHNDGIGSVSNGFEYANTAQSFSSPTPWGECCYFHRVTLVTDEAYPHVNFDQGFAISGGISPVWKDVETRVHFFGDGRDPEIRELSGVNPRDMTEEERERWGIKKTPDNEEIIHQMDDGEEISLDFVATKNPMAVDEVEHVTKIEGEDIGPRE